MSRIDPSDPAEALALFRAEIIGALASRPLNRGELRAALRSLAKTRYRPPGADHTRTFSVPTLERWLYRYKRDGLPALRPIPRSDRGRAHALTDAQRALVLDIRREHPSAAVPLIVRTLEGDGRIDAGDEQWGRLLVWSDVDSDRVSAAHELSSVAMRDLVAIELDHVVDRRCDARGNCEIERGGFLYRDGRGRELQGAVIDVHLRLR